eukprot:UN15695
MKKNIFSCKCAKIGCLEFSHICTKKMGFFIQNISKTFSTQFQTPMKVSNIFSRS